MTDGAPIRECHVVITVNCETASAGQNEEGVSTGRPKVTPVLGELRIRASVEEGTGNG